MKPGHSLMRHYLQFKDLRAEEYAYLFERAKTIKQRFPEDIARRLHALHWWDCSNGAIRELAPLLSVPPDEAVLDRLEKIVARDRAQKEGPV